MTLENLRTKYQYINFVLVEKKTKTYVFGCHSNRDKIELGRISWYPGWRKYCFFPGSGTIFSKGCLYDIQNFVVQLESLRKIENQGEQNVQG